MGTPLPPANGLAGGDPFDLLGVAPAFALDLGELERHHRELSRVLHPDRHRLASAAERRATLNQAIAVNAAWRVLRDPIRRAEALCHRLGLPLAESGQQGVSPEVLLSVIEGREALAAARQAGAVAEVARLGEQAAAEESVLLGALARAFTGLGVEDAAAGRGEIVRLLGELRYARRFLDEVRATEEALL